LKLEEATKGILGKATEEAGLKSD